MEENNEKKDQNVFEEVSKKVSNKNGLAALSYIWVLCLVPLLGSKDEFVKFHAKQGFVLFIIELALILVAWIPVIGWLLSLIVALVAIIGLIKALNGEKWEIPYVYNWSKKIKI
jgi:fumarate reductase subunit D